MLPPLSSTSWMTMARAIAPASVTWRLATVRPGSALWQTLQDTHWWKQSPHRLTPPDSRAETPKLTWEHGKALRQQWLHQPPTTPARSAHHTTPRAHKLASGARGHTRQVQRNTMDRGTDPPQFARANQNIAAAVMLLRDLSEPNDLHEHAIHRNLQAQVETATIQQAESFVL